MQWIHESRRSANWGLELGSDPGLAGAGEAWQAQRLVPIWSLNIMWHCDSIANSLTQAEPTGPQENGCLMPQGIEYMYGMTRCSR
jgi:hypothetical protein